MTKKDNSTDKLTGTTIDTTVYDHLIVGCGNRGLSTLAQLLESQNAGESTESAIVALEASSRIGGTQFLISRTSEAHVPSSPIFEVVRQLPELKIWWEKNWVSPAEVEWTAKDWAFIIPQWQNFFQPLVELKVKADVTERVKTHVQLETPVSEICFKDELWHVRSGEHTFKTKNLHWTLGLKALQSCIGKKEAEEFMEKNSAFQEAARDAEGVFVATYPGAQGEAQFVAIPVRHDHKLYLSFVSIFDGHAECFTFLHSDLLKFPKDLSSFEKSLKRTLKHTLSHYLPEVQTPTVGVFSEAKGYSMASPWKLKNRADKNIFFVEENIDTALAATTDQTREAGTDL